MNNPHFIYDIFSLGSFLRSPKDKEVAAALNKLTTDGWEILNVAYPYGSKPKIIARRPLSEQEIRQQKWPK